MTSIIPSPEEALVKKLDVTVLSKANPRVGLLRLARIVVQQSPSVQEVFNAAKEHGVREGKRQVDRNLLVERLSVFFPEDDGVKNVADYLADEYEQVGDGILLISSETGKAIARLSDEDFYLPSPVPRESGRMAQPGLKVRPELEGFLIHWQFETLREQEVRLANLAKLNQTELLREEGDRRALISSKQGRKNIAQDVLAALPTLFQGATGIAKDFLGFFTLGVPPEETLLTPVEVVLGIQLRRQLQDLLAFNYRHDPLTSILSSLSSGWAWSLAGHVLTLCQKRIPNRYFSLDEVVCDRKDGLWLSDPNFARLFQSSGHRVLPANGPKDLVVHLHKKPLGFLNVHAGSEHLKSFELSDKWNMDASVKVTIWVDWDNVEGFLVLPPTDFDIRAEII